MIFTMGKKYLFIYDYFNKFSITVNRIAEDEIQLHVKFTAIYLISLKT